MIRKTGLAVLTASATLILVTGCSSGERKGTDLASIKGNLTPELEATAERDVDMEVNWAMNADQDLRGVWNDLGRFWLTDRPSQLSPYPIMPTGGQP
jgi:hypothetical protein